MKNDDEYKKIFLLPNGKELKVRNNYEGRYLECAIKREHVDKEHKHKDTASEGWRNVRCKMIKRHKDYFNRETLDRYSCIETYVIAEDRDWIEYDAVPYYDTSCSNTLDFKKIEVILQVDNFKRRIFLEWQGNAMMFSYFSNIAEEILEMIEDGKINGVTKHDSYHELEMYTDEGEWGGIEIENIYKIESMIVSVRVVEYKRKIFDKIEDVYSSNYDFKSVDEKREDYVSIKKRRKRKIGR